MLLEVLRVCVNVTAATLGDIELTSEFHVQLGVDEFVSLQYHPEASPFVHCLVCLLWLAEGQIVVVVCLLRVIVWAHFVHPQPHRLPNIILFPHTRSQTLCLCNCSDGYVH